MAERNVKKEAQWLSANYKRFEVRLRNDSEELKLLTEALNGKSFGEWVREQLKKDK